jgi:hypothetical protein
VSPGSQTETFAALQLGIDNWRWLGVPFFIRAGKALAVQATEVRIIFKLPPHLAFAQHPPHPDEFILRIDPHPGADLMVQAMKPSADMTQTVDLSLIFPKELGDPPEPYERLLGDALRGDAMLFTREDGVEQTWRIVQPLLDAPSPVQPYAPGSWGPASTSRLDKPPSEDPRAAVMLWAQVFGKPLTWDDLPWLRSLTTLPLVVKGILHPDDARRAIDGGVDGIYCSNHGGRQANGGLAALDCLAEVVDACGDTPVLFDSGVRSGADLVKALALGATAVGIGRPYAWGLALGGDDGVVHVLRSILAEADLIMAVDGYPTRAGLTRDSLRQVH